MAQSKDFFILGTLDKTTSAALTTGVRKHPKAPTWEKSLIMIFKCLYSINASLNADLGKNIIFLHLLFFHVYFITGLWLGSIRLLPRKLFILHNIDHGVVIDIYVPLNAILTKIFWLRSEKLITDKSTWPFSIFPNIGIVQEIKHIF